MTDTTWGLVVSWCLVNSVNDSIALIFKKYWDFSVVSLHVFHVEHATATTLSSFKLLVVICHSMY